MVSAVQQAVRPTSSLPTATKDRSAGIDMLLVFRAFAGIFVVISHVYFGVFTAANGDQIWTWDGANFSFLFNGAAQSGVFMFFCLSGYLMGKGFFRGRYSSDGAGARQFYWNRLVRIMPSYAFYILIAMTIGGATLPDLPATLKMLLNLFTFTYGMDQSQILALLGHLWTISTEVQFYLIVPLLMAWFARRPPSRRWAIAAVALLAVIGFAARTIVWAMTHQALGLSFFAQNGPSVSLWSTWIDAPVWMNLDCFISGLLLNFVVVEPLAKTRQIHIVRFLLGIGGFYVIASLVSHGGVTMQWTPLWLLMWALALPTATIAFSLVMIYWGERLRLGKADDVDDGTLGLLRVLSLLGTLTYGIYLWHVAFLNRPFPFLPQDPSALSYGIRFAAVFVPAVIAAAAVYTGIELPFDRLKHYFKKAESL